MYTVQWPGVPFYPGVKRRENQDVVKHYVSDDKNLIILSVFDGHGERYGRIAAEVAAAAIVSYLLQQSDVKTNTECRLCEAFDKAHDSIREELWRQGPERMLDHNGVVFEKNNVIMGGTTATVAVIINQHDLFVANVGDSDAILLDKEGFKLLTSSHSPENVEEKKRIDATVCKKPLFLYSGSSTKLPKQIYSSSGEVTKRGNYTKNVRNELASIVSVDYRHQVYFLAMTRSLGDFYFHAHGVSSKPSINKYTMENKILLLCSDGVWDNWKYEDVQSVIAAKKLNNQRDIDGIGNEFFNETLYRGLNNFGNKRDDMTFIIFKL